MYSADEAQPHRLREVLGLPDAQDAAMEEAMDDGSRKPAKAEAPAKTETAGKGKAQTAKKERAAKEAKPPKAEKPKRERVENPVVFAFRLSEADRTRIHEAAGPAGATRFVRSAALAAATGDEKAFEALITQAKTNLK